MRRSIEGPVMENGSMGRVLTEATVYNLGDLIEVERGKLAANDVRKVVIPEALVDTGATTLSMPRSLLDQIGLTKRYEKRAITAGGERTMSVYGTARVVIMGRDCVTDVVEVPEGNPVLIGQIPLEMMDWVVDLQSRKLIGNPAHGGDQILEMY
ncbi:MAG TPA: aspartyl protease family protein [Urbifossiella sp.]